MAGTNIRQPGGGGGGGGGTMAILRIVFAALCLGTVLVRLPLSVKQSSFLLKKETRGRAGIATDSPPKASGRRTTSSGSAAGTIPEIAAIVEVPADSSDGDGDGDGDSDKIVTAAATAAGNDPPSTTSLRKGSDHSPSDPSAARATPEEILATIARTAQAARAATGASDTTTSIGSSTIATETAQATTATGFTATTNGTTITNPNRPFPVSDPDKTLSLIYPSGLLGGYRNQAMRFTGLLKHALEEGYGQVLLPTLVWSTRYSVSRFAWYRRDHMEPSTSNGTSTEEEEEETTEKALNPVVSAWPIPFDELFDVDHWNSFHKPGIAAADDDDIEHNFSLPRLVSSVVVDDDDINPSPEKESGDRTVCWTPNPDRSIVSIPAIEAKRNNTTPYRKSLLPLLTHRMLFGDDDENEHEHDQTISKRRRRKNFLLDPVQADAVEFLTGDALAKFVHKVDMLPRVENCTHPRVFGGKSKVLWNNFLQIARAGEPKKRWYRKLIETVDEALVPAKPWRQLADQCVEHHLGLSVDEFHQEEEDPHARGHDHGYIALHARIEPEMLQHPCGATMEKNLTKILDLVNDLAEDYNGLLEAPQGSDRPAGPIGVGTLRAQLFDHTTTTMRKLTGTFVAVARDELNDVGSFTKYKDITLYNKNVLNERTISYDNSGGELYTTSLEAKEQQRQQQQQQKEPPPAESIRRRRLDDGNLLNESSSSSDRGLPVFECGEGWVKHAFYKIEARQRKLFTPSDPSEFEKGYGLYHKYGSPPESGSDSNGSAAAADDDFPLLPLPEEYFGDLLPSMLNFWLAVRADVFVGVRGSSWSTDVWTTRYYMGKGDRNYEYTSKSGVSAMGNGGLPPPHKNCRADDKKKKRRGRGKK